MKSKAPLTLMELLIMVLVFAMAVGICVRIFVASDLLSQEADRRDRGVFCVENAAELVKYHSGNLEEIAESMKSSVDGDTIKVYYNDAWERCQREEAAYGLTVEPISSPQKGMGAAEVTAALMDGTELFGITVAWQEVI